MDFLQYFFSLNRKAKRIISIVIDALFIIISLYFAFAVEYKTLRPINISDFLLLVSVLIPFSIFSFIRFGLYRAILRYLSLQVLTAIIGGTLFSSLTLLVFAFFGNLSLPLAIIILYASFTLVLVGGSRALIRFLVRQGNKKTGIPVIIYGAGSSGRQLVTALAGSREYTPIAFVDDEPSLHGTVIQGIYVHSPSVIKKLIYQRSILKILLAIPSASNSKRKQILNKLTAFPVQVLTIPGMTDLVDGKVSFSDIKEVDIEDLLGRDAVAPNLELLQANIFKKSVMVTGAGGSIGSELCRQVLRQNPKKLILFEISEFALYAIDNELQALKHNLKLDVEIYPILGSVQNRERLSRVMHSFNIQTIYHAAAYKHVPLVAYNPVEGIKNNIFGTMNTALSAISAGVESFVLISTDKAVRPTNTMGTTKRIAELVLQSLSAKQTATRFCMVRFGNVLGSSGSVVPLFKKQIANGGPITVTHPEITRYFMTIPEASQLVIQAGAMGKGGDVFVLDMGQSVKIIDLAKNMIRLSGLSPIDESNPDGDIEIKFTGLRPGEKLYEELLVGNNVHGTEHKRIMTANEIFLPWDELKVILDKLEQACNEADLTAIREIFLAAPTGFASTYGIYDLIWLENKKKENNSNIELDISNEKMHLVS